MAIKYINDYEALPSTAPSSHPRVIDVKTINCEELAYIPTVNLWDAVVTMLYNISPSTLDRFFEEKPFKLIQSSKFAGNEAQVIIFKKNKEVLVGTYIEHKGPDQCFFEWDHLIRCKIENDGSWNIDSASYGLNSAPKWEAVWGGNFFETMQGRADVALDNINKSEKASLQAQEILNGELWDPEHSTWNITSNHW